MIDAARLRLLLAAAVLLFASDALVHGCAHSPPAVKACTDQLTPELETLAAKSLARTDYEAAIAADFGGVASCLVVAAVEAAIDNAHNVLRTSSALSSGAAPGTSPPPPRNTAIELHGQAWLAAHRSG